MRRGGVGLVLLSFLGSIALRSDLGEDSNGGLREMADRVGFYRHGCSFFLRIASEGSSTGSAVWARYVAVLWSVRPGREIWGCFGVGIPRDNQGLLLGGRWPELGLETLKVSVELARDQFLIQPVSNTLVTVMCMHEADKTVIDSWQRLRCERSEVRIHPWVPQRRLGPEERRAQLMQDYYWVEFRHIPVEIQAAFVYDFGMIYDIVAFIDPFPSFVAKRDDYLMLALDFAPGQPFSLDDVIPYRIGGKEYMIHTAHKMRPWCPKCRSYGHLSTEYACPRHPQKRTQVSGRLLRDPNKTTHRRVVDLGHKGWVYIEERTKEGTPRGWVWERTGEPEWETPPPSSWTPPTPVEEKMQQMQVTSPLKNHEDQGWTKVGRKGKKEIWTPKKQVGSNMEQKEESRGGNPEGTLGFDAIQYIPTVNGSLEHRNRGGASVSGQADGEVELKGNSTLAYGEVELKGQIRIQDNTDTREMEIPEGNKSGQQEEIRERLARDLMRDPFQAAFAPEPMDVDPLLNNASASPEGLGPGREEKEAGEEGVPPPHMVVEQKLVAIADRLMSNLKVKYGPLTDDFWEHT
ncbi:hypothetical protein CBR_g38463 [Chara braunii]|uniref:DUF4283 domain-containing protein n=1 Tax=Chara braunii TaxID=69332 RepID=A0A388JNT7_CHABU|nr:hypothetical protein CBR_g38463 [Chara braunii]|eukprot:GBG59438.1 hypothetical protein CBR_g38463 [Chara braunii]